MKRRILIVEDEAVTSVMLEKTLKELGYEVVGSAFDGAEALSLARDKKPDIVLMDIRIQGEMDGIETAKRIYQQLGIPIIYLTAHSDDDTIRRAVQSGPFGYLIKPFKERELYSNIEMVAHKHKLYQTTTPKRPQQTPTPEAEIASPTQEPVRNQSSPLKPGDYRLAILAIQSIPHPVILFNMAGDVVFSNNACKMYFKLDAQKKETIHALADLPDLYGKIWDSGKDHFSEGKGFAINGSISVKENVRRARIEMIPLMDHGNLQFITSILIPEPSVGGGALGGMNTLLDEAENQLKEIRLLSSTEETYRMRQISLSTSDILKKLREIREISYPGGEKENNPDKFR